MSYHLARKKSGKSLVWICDQCGERQSADELLTHIRDLEALYKDAKEHADEFRNEIKDLEAKLHIKTGTPPRQ